MIHIIDYGLGNVQGFINLYKRMGFKSTRAKCAADLIGASKIILPGVGSFDHAMALLNKSGMRQLLETLVLVDKVPVLGVCVGMQILASSSDEGRLAGLGMIPGRVKSFSSSMQFKNLPLPHMGWNDVSLKHTHPLFLGLGSNPQFYFLHSYYFESDQPSHIAATTLYGIEFGCAISLGNIFGVQFHPEKSHRFGSQLLRNFAEF
jgi:glutamine amidotransferase